MKKWALVLTVSVLALTGCKPTFENKDKAVQETEQGNEEEAIIPKYSISNDYYKVVMPFKTSQSRGLTVNKVDNRLDLDELESGLMRLSTNTFSTDSYFYQEGQYLDSTTIRSWLQRKYTKKQLKENKLTEAENVGLNPIDDEKGNLEERNEKNPLYLAHILEQNYLKKDKNGKLKLAGVSIALSMNSVHYFKQENDYQREVEITPAQMKKQGEKMAAEVVKRLRSIKGLEKVPIVVGLFAEQPKNSLVSGHYFSTTEVKKDSTKLGDWEDVNEKYILFPSSAAEKNNRNDYTIFNNFKAEIQEYFPNYTGVIGNGYYIEDQLTELKIQMPVQFYGKAEIIGFTQYVAGLVMEHFPSYLKVDVTITSPEGIEAIIVKKEKAEEPFVNMLTP